MYQNQGHFGYLRKDNARDPKVRMVAQHTHKKMRILAYTVPGCPVDGYSNYHGQWKSSLFAPT